MARLGAIEATGPMLFEGQTRLSFLAEAAKAAGNLSHRLLLLDCNNQERARRLAARGQPELANATMMEWAEYLRRDAAAHNCSVLDTSFTTLQASVDHVLTLLDAWSRLVAPRRCGGLSTPSWLPLSGRGQDGVL